jgi:predicted AAA+ superfamily ATPase
MPLSFKECRCVFENENKFDLFRCYLVESSFPYALQFKGDKRQIRDYLGGVYSAIVLKDVIENKKIRDVDRLKRVIKFIAYNIGNLTSIKKISKRYNDF